jgi:formate dehydrogenase iron-sulfur subunit
MIGILTDVTKCVGCNKCVEACVEINDLGPCVPTHRVNGDGLGSQRFTSIVRAPEGGRYVRKQCRHCLDPACVSACIVGALTRNADGAVVYDAKKCMGCRYCMMACPFAIPRYSWEDAIPYIRKCKLCWDTRIVKGQQPACTEVCPQKATIFGNRDDLLREAHDRINQNPGKYLNKVYGETEVGGTAVLYISDVPLDFLAWSRKLSPTPPPHLTWHVLKEVPFEFLGMGAIMSGIYWITGRREKVAKAEGKAHDAAPADKEKHDDKA